MNKIAPTLNFLTSLGHEALTSQLNSLSLEGKYFFLANIFIDYFLNIVYTDWAW